MSMCDHFWSDPYVCCDRKREIHAKVGALYIPMSSFPVQRQASPSWTPHWDRGKWKSQGWGTRFVGRPPDRPLVLMERLTVDTGDLHLDPVVLGDCVTLMECVTSSK